MGMNSSTASASIQIPRGSRTRPGTFLQGEESLILDSLWQTLKTMQCRLHLSGGCPLEITSPSRTTTSLQYQPFAEGFLVVGGDGVSFQSFLATLFLPIIARLDADGNEIPTEEEEALERARAQIRIRDQDQSHSALTMFQMVRDRVFVDRNEERHLVPTTQSPGPEHSASPSPNVRVYINSTGILMRDVASVGMLGTDVAMPDEPAAPQISSPYHTNPLPMPLEDMVDASYSKRHPHVNGAKRLKVSRFAQFAGR